MMGINDTLDLKMDFNLITKVPMPQLETNNDEVIPTTRDAIRPPMSETWI